MEVAHQLRRRQLSLRARWLPRLENEEADALTNRDVLHFSPENRIPVKLDRLGFQVLPELFKAGDDYLDQLEKLKAATKKAEPKAELAERAKKRLRGDKGLRETDPW